MNKILSYLIEEPLKGKSNASWHYIGNVLYAGLNNGKRVKLELISEKTFNCGECIQNLTVSIIDKSHGLIDKVMISFESAFVSNPNKYLRKRTDSNIYEWVALPNNDDINRLAEVVMDYMKLWMD
ncbi:hypothetical protein DW886_14800 [Enterocloster aldenensis]|uniref:hypothetical protein n=1 Tax=Enterocloster aldenensis TaxID=358742 RepID=UPI000E46C8B1|nr:hypothetical protein DW886_14800 [Enterocloster aldenensis]